MFRWRSLGPLISLVLLLPSSGLAEPDEPDEPDDEHLVLVGGSAGFSYHSGRSVVLDAISGASTPRDVAIFSSSGLEGTIFGEAGFALGPGNLGARAAFGASAPGPYYLFTAMPRYRLLFEGSEPWMGVGISFDRRVQTATSYVGLAVALGWDFELSKDFLLTFTADAVLANPSGSQREAMMEGRPVELEDHHNRLSVALGLAYRLF